MWACTGGAVKRLLLVLALGGVASAQPMMVDPSRMSGIPRPDPQVAAHTLTVRLIRGELSHRLVGVTVELLDDKGNLLKQQVTDEAGRATFPGLADGPWFARAESDGQELVTQPISMPAEAGVRVMLVFSAGGVGTVDGLARVDAKLAEGTLVVRALDAKQAPLLAVEIILGHARTGAGEVEEKKGKSNALGEARFSGLEVGSDSGYLVEVLHQGARFSSKPFRLQKGHGSRVVMAVVATSSDLALLSLQRGSHLFFQVGDEALQGGAVWLLENSGTSPVDPGPSGLRLPLPEGAVSAQVMGEGPPNFSVQGDAALYKGPIPPGQTKLEVLFVLAYKKDRLAIRQATPIAFSDVAVVVPYFEGVGIEGSGAQASGKSEEREVGEGKVLLFRAPGSPAGGAITFELTGLPYSSSRQRLVAAALACAIVLALVAYAAGGGASKSGIAADRNAAFETLVAFELKSPVDARHREKLLQRVIDLDQKLGVDA